MIKYILYISIFIFGFIFGIVAHFDKPEIKPKEKEIRDIINKMNLENFTAKNAHILFYIDKKRTHLVNGKNIFFTSDGRIKISGAELVKFDDIGNVEFRIESKEAFIER